MSDGYDDQPIVRGTGETMTIINRATKQMIAEYRLTPGSEAAEMQQMRRAIREHLANGGKIGNYQW